MGAPALQGPEAQLAALAWRTAMPAGTQQALNRQRLEKKRVFNF